MMYKLLFTTLFLLLFVAGCDKPVPTSLKPSEYPYWFQESGGMVVKEREMGEVGYKAIFQPPEYRVVKYAEKDDSEKDLKVMYTDAQQEACFVFRILGKNGQHPFVSNEEAQYFERLAYLNTIAQNDFQLIQNEVDTIPCKFLHLSRNFQTAPFIDLILTFQLRSTKISSLKLIYNDKLFNNGTINFLFDEEINQLPTLDI